MLVVSLSALQAPYSICHIDIRHLIMISSICISQLIILLLSKVALRLIQVTSQEFHTHNTLSAKKVLVVQESPLNCCCSHFWVCPTPQSNYQLPKGSDVSDNDDDADNGDDDGDNNGDDDDNDDCH